LNKLRNKEYPVVNNQLISRPLRAYVGAVVGVLLWGFTLSAQAQLVSGELTTVRVESRALADTVLLDGVIEAVQQSTVSAQTSGKVLQLPFDVDDSVRPGDLIVQLEDSEQRARVSQAQAAVNEAQASLADARQSFARIESVHKRGLVSGQEFDQARNNLAGAQARAERADAGMVEAREQLSYTRIEAPYGGILTERHVEVGESVSPGQALLSGLSLEQLRVVVDLPQRYAASARAERQATVTLADGRVLKTGEMTFYPYASAKTHTFRLRMALTEPNGSLFPGMLVKVEVPVSHSQTLLIPASSLVQRSELRAVYVLDSNGNPRLRQVRTGKIADGQIEILAGVSAGEQVVVNAAELLGSARLPLPSAQEQKP
jgi:RND family efflux transporter MFP subunit